jgi:hypothetical protein
VKCGNGDLLMEIGNKGLALETKKFGRGNFGKAAL